MNISILTATREWGGVERHTMHLAAALNHKGHEVSILQLGHNLYEGCRAELPERILLQHVDLPKPLDQLSWREAWVILRQARGDVCVFEKGDFEAGNLALDLAARMQFHRYIAVEQLLAPAMPGRSRERRLAGVLPWAGLWWYRLYWDRRIRGVGPSRVVCVSDAVRSRLIDEYRYPRRKTLTVCNGIDAALFRPHPEWRRAVRRSWGVPDNALVFGAVGRLAPIKGYDAAIELFGQLQLTKPGENLRLVLVGEGPARESLLRAAEATGFSDRIIFPGRTEKPWEAFSAIDVFIMTSLSEGMPLALLEAMASGCSPIAMGVGGVPEVITTPAAGWLINPGDGPGFLAAMQAAAATDRGQLDRMGAAAREIVATRFNGETQFNRLMAIIEAGSAAPNGAGGSAMASSTAAPAAGLEG